MCYINKNHSLYCLWQMQHPQLVAVDNMLFDVENKIINVNNF
jgi:hypothetical protein